MEYYVSALAAPAFNGLVASLRTGLKDAGFKDVDKSVDKEDGEVRPLRDVYLLKSSPAPARCFITREGPQDLHAHG